jgi:hypothetical protein
MLPKSRLPKELYSASTLNVSYLAETADDHTSPSLTHMYAPRCDFGELALGGLASMYPA